MALSQVSPVVNRGVISGWLDSIPDSGTEMLTISSTGVVSRQAIPNSDDKLPLAGGTLTGTLTAPEYRSPRAGSLSHVNPQNNIVLYGGFSGYGIGFDGNGELGTVVNSTLRSRLGQHLGLGSAGQVRFNSSADTSGSWDTLILRNATGPTLETRSASGLRVRNADGSAAGALACGTLTAVTNPAQPNASVRLESNPVDYSTTVQSGIGFYSNISGLRRAGISLDNSEVFQIQATQGSGVGTLLRMSISQSRAVFRRADDSAAAAIDCGAITASGTGIVASFGSDPAVVQVGSRGDSAPSVNAFLGGYSAAAGNVSTIYYGQNLYYDGTNWVHPYVAGRSSLFYQQNGAFYWNTHAGNAATGVGTERMSLNNSGTLTVNGTVNATNVRCQGGSGIVGTRYINNSNDTWSAFEFPANQTSLTFSPGASGLFRLEGTTSSHVALKRNGSTLQVRLADDSAAAPIDAGANSKIGDWSFGWFGIRASNGSGVGIGNSTGEFQIYNSYNNQVFNTLSVADGSTSNRVYLNNTTEWRDPSAALATRATLNCNTGALSCGAITANGALTVNNAAGIYETGSGRTVAFTSNFSASTPGIGTTTNHDFCIYTNGANERLRIASTGAITTGQTITSGMQTLVADPSTVDITAGLNRMVKNSTSGEVRHWVNDGGTMKSVLFS